MPTLTVSVDVVDSDPVLASDQSAPDRANTGIILGYD
jgi:hypothetical protein